jgi:hypothetical protein
MFGDFRVVNTSFVDRTFELVEVGELGEDLDRIGLEFRDLVVDCDGFLGKTLLAVMLRYRRIAADRMLLSRVFVYRSPSMFNVPKSFESFATTCLSSLIAA